MKISHRSNLRVCILLGISAGLALCLAFVLLQVEAATAKERRQQTAQPRTTPTATAEPITRTLGWRARRTENVPGILQETLIYSEMGSGGGPVECESVFLTGEPGGEVWVTTQAYNLAVNDLEYSSATISASRCAGLDEFATSVYLTDPNGDELELFHDSYEDSESYSIYLTQDYPAGLYTLEIVGATDVFTQFYWLEHTYLNEVEVSLQDAETQRTTAWTFPGESLVVDYQTDDGYSYVEVGLYKHQDYSCRDDSYYQARIVDTWMIRTDSTGHYREVLPVPADLPNAQYVIAATTLDRLENSKTLQIVEELQQGDEIIRQFEPEMNSAAYVFYGQDGETVELQVEILAELEDDTVHISMYDPNGDWVSPLDDEAPSSEPRQYQLPATGYYQVQLYVPYLDLCGTTTPAEYRLLLEQLDGAHQSGETEQTVEKRPIERRDFSVPTHLAFTVQTSQGEDIFVTDVQSAQQRRLTGPNDADETEPDWSHTGRQIVYQSNIAGNDDIWLTDLQNGESRPLTTGGADEREPDWSPIGNLIVYRVGGEPAGQGELWLMNTDGSKQRRLGDRSIQGRAPVWSPDGQKIAFISQQDRDWQLNIYDMHSQEIQTLTGCFDVQCLDPNWSPDGHFLVFSTSAQAQDALDEIWCIRADGTDDVQLIARGDNLRHPTWSLDGLVAFESDTGLELVKLGNRARFKIENAEAGSLPEWSW